jgi:small-conductance mechanosensitive channel
MSNEAAELYFVHEFFLGVIGSRICGAHKRTWALALVQRTGRAVTGSMPVFFTSFAYFASSLGKERFAASVVLMLIVLPCFAIASALQALRGRRKRVMDTLHRRAAARRADDGEPTLDQVVGQSLLHHRQISGAAGKRRGADYRTQRTAFQMLLRRQR